jgi:hypothetical protein
MSTNQVAKLLQDLYAKGIEARDALPVIKALVEARIMSLDEITAHTELPSDIPSNVQRKIRPSLTRKKELASSPTKKRKIESIFVPEVVSEAERIHINRSPVLTLWAAIVAEKIANVTFTEAISLGGALVSLIAKGKGVSLGIFSDADGGNSSAQAIGADREFDLLGTRIKANSTSAGIRGIGESGEEVDPFRTWNLLQRRFGQSLGYVYRTLCAAAEAAGDSLPETAYQFYMHIRPQVPCGAKGWGAHGYLEMHKVSSFYSEKKKSVQY